MPPRKKAPVARIYQAEDPIHQQTFPRRRTTVHSRHYTNSPQLLRQETLTQMPFGSSTFAGDVVQRDFQENDRPRKRRRKTEGDGDEDRKRHYTQTLTQAGFVTGSSFEEGEEVTLVADTEDEDEDEIVDHDGSSEAEETENESNKENDLDERGAADNTKVVSQEQQYLRNNSNHPLGDLITPQEPVLSPTRSITHDFLYSTPRKHLFEIPSSQSPFTPLSIRKRSLPGTPIYIDSSREASPMRSSPSPIAPRHQRRPKLKVEDTYDGDSTDLSSLPTESYTRKYLSSKVDHLAQLSVSSLHVGKTIHHSQSVPPGTTTIVKTEIEDSEADSDDELETQYCDDFGNETQMIVERILSSPKPTRHLRSTSPILSASSPTLPTKDTQSKRVTFFMDEGRFPSTPHDALKVSSLLPSDHAQMESQRLSTQVLDALAPQTDDSDVFVCIHSSQVANILSRAKDHDFRPYALPPKVARLWIYEPKPISAMKYMACVSASKRPGEIQNIDGVGNEAFNDGKGTSKFAYEITQLYELAHPVTLDEMKRRRWLERAPNRFTTLRPAIFSQLMANLMHAVFSEDTLSRSSPLISRGRSQSQSQDPRSDSQQAEAQLQCTMLQFSEPVHGSIEAENESQHYDGNMPTLIGSSESKFEAALDLLSTQQDSYRDCVPPQHRNRVNNNGTPRPSQATTVDYTQTPSPRKAVIEDSQFAFSQQLEDDVDDDDEDQEPTIIPNSPLIFDTLPVTQMVQSSPTSSSNMLPPSLPSLSNCRDVRSFDHLSNPSSDNGSAEQRMSWLAGGDFGLRSSQIMTRSQMLPESMLNDEIFLPPMQVEDSEDEGQ